MKTTLTIAGSDSSGGAGIQADLKTMTANGVYAMSAITALTAQNTVGVQGIYEVSPEFLGQQLDSIFTDIRPDAIKIGMVSSVELIHMIAEKLKKYNGEKIVVDPVMVATSGAKLIADDAIDTLKKELFPLATVLTPNIPEAEVLADMEIKTTEEMILAAEKISKSYHCAVLCKGGHSINDANDLLYRDGSYCWFHGKRIQNPNTHGTGCTLSSAIASNLAKGYDLDTSVKRAKEYISGALQAMLDLGAGSGPMAHNFDLNSRFAQECGNGATAQMVAAAADIWKEYHTHPFVKGIQNGDLDKEKFKYYMIQDYLYLIEYAKVFAIGSAKAKDQKIIQLFEGYLHQIFNGEMDIHRAYMQRLGITEQEISETKMSLDNLSYISYMQKIAYEGGAAEVMAAILSCALSYEAIARQMVEKCPGCEKHEFYGEWITGYASKDYHEGNEKLIELMDALCEDYSKEQMRHLIKVFVNCSRYEGAFWEMAWERKN